MRRVLLQLALFLVLCSHAPIFAQGCAACRTNAAQASPQAQRGLRRGIAVLIIPSLLMFSALLVLAYKHRGESS